MYNPYKKELNEKVKVSAIVPVYNEDQKIFEKCLRSIKDNNPDEIIVVMDEPTQNLKKIAEKYADKNIVFGERRGKREALGEGLKVAEGDIVMLVDSDMILSKDCLIEIIKPFRDKKVGAVSTVHDVYPTGNGFGGYMSWKCAKIIERNREVVDKALNNNLVVVDGRCNAYRRELLERYIDDFLNETYFGESCHIGDDRYFTYRLNYDKWKTVVQSTAKGDTAAPETFGKFVKQQLRWAKSGRKFFLREIRHNLFRKVGIIYGIHSVTYYLSAISFTVAIVMDLLLAEDLGMRFPSWSLLFLIPLGSAMVNMIRQIIVLGSKSDLSNSFWYGIIGIFILYPMNIYAWFVFKDQALWYTRGREV